jgi:cytochrome b
VLALAGSWWTSERGMSETHALFGYSVIGLLLFRIGWGLCGSETSRFRSFLNGPGAALEHFRHLSRPGKLERTMGHNALGGYMVVVLLLALLVQVGTGLFLYDDELFWAPLNGWVNEETAEALEEIHEINFNIILGLAAVHVAAVLFYWVVKGLNLIGPMVTGRAELPEGKEPPRMASASLALFLAALAGLLVWGLVTYA